MARRTELESRIALRLPRTLMARVNRVADANWCRRSVALRMVIERGVAELESRRRD